MDWETIDTFRSDQAEMLDKILTDLNEFSRTLIGKQNGTIMKAYPATLLAIFHYVYQ